MTNQELSLKLNTMLENKNLKSLKEFLPTCHFADIAEYMEEITSTQALIIFKAMPKDEAAQLFSFLEPNLQKEFIESFQDSEKVDLVANMFIDDAVDFLEELPSNVVRRILDMSSPQIRSNLNKFLNYAENTAGSVMTEEFIKLKEGLSVGEAINSIRNSKKKTVMQHICYVTTTDGKLAGVVSVNELLINKDETLVSDLLKKDVVSVNTSTDNEEVVELIQKYDFSSLPVTDSDNRLVGIVTVDDAFDIAEENATEDFEKMAALTPADETYLDTSVFTHVKNRLPWLLILLISGMLNGLILGKFESSFVTIPLLVTFIPMLTDTGGNSGSQSSTLIIRGMALREIEPSDLLKVIFKELRVSLMVGFVLAIICFIRIMMFGKADMLIAFTVSLAMMCVVVISKICGGVLPVFAKVLGFDPALMAAPLITTIVDAAGLFIFFTLSQSILGI